jgi:hypothetical protein
MQSDLTRHVSITALTIDYTQPSIILLLKLEQGTLTRIIPLYCLRNSHLLDIS